jgi:C4-type Zn-finger protein
MDFMALYGEAGMIGVVGAMFVYMLVNLTKSQTTQSESLDNLAVSQAKSEETITNVEGILLKLLDRIQRESENQQNSSSRRHESLMKEVDDLSDKISYISGRINGGGAKH